MDVGFALKKFIAALLLPPGGFIWLLAMGALLSTRQRRLGMAMVWLGIALLYLASLPVVSHSLQASIERDFRPWNQAAMQRGALQPKAIVILGGGVVRGALEYGGETLKAYTLRRVRYGARVARITGLPILVSGGRSDDDVKYPEAVLMDEALRVDFGVTTRWREARSKDTFDNAEFSVPLLRKDGIDTIILVTDIDHMPRAQREFEARGIKVVPAATNYWASIPLTWQSWVVPSISAFSQNADLMYEALGRVWQGLMKILRG